MILAETKSDGIFNWQIEKIVIHSWSIGTRDSWQSRSNLINWYGVFTSSNLALKANLFISERRSVSGTSNRKGIMGESVWNFTRNTLSLEASSFKTSNLTIMKVLLWYWTNVSNDLLFFGLVLWEMKRKCLVKDCTLDQISMVQSATSSFSVHRVGQNFNGKSLFAFSLMYRSFLDGE